MSEAYPFTPPLDDILFTLRYIGGQKDDTSAEIISHFAAFAQNEIAPLNASGDAQGCKLIAGQVVMPDGFKAIYQRLAQDGWQGLTLSEEYGGQGMDALTLAGVSEIFSGANHSLQMVASLPGGAAEVLTHFGSAQQRAAWLPHLASGEWLSTMAITEPQAGSDLSAIACKAHHIDGETWQISGEKIFISGGGQDLAQTILHLVLARSDGGSGIKGLSLFGVVAHTDDNYVQVARLEEKLGLHASPTCHLVFDKAPAQLIGTRGQGLQAMFAMMNHARLDVALQGVAHAARAADIAKRHATSRVQGKTAQGGPAYLADHADIAAMVTQCERLALGARALCHLVLARLRDPQSAALVDFLTPVTKVFCTKAGIDAADLAIQVLGGYGYLREYGAEQNWRDARICAIYEGANGIHARGLATRSLQIDNGAGIDAFSAFLTQADISPHDWRAQAQALRQTPDPTPLAQDFMTLTADLAYRAAWAHLIKHADHAPDPDRLRRLGQF